MEKLERYTRRVCGRLRAIAKALGMQCKYIGQRQKDGGYRLLLDIMPLGTGTSEASNGSYSTAKSGMDEEMPAK